MQRLLYHLSGGDGLRSAHAREAGHADEDDRRDGGRHADGGRGRQDGVTGPEGARPAGQVEPATRGPAHLAVGLVQADGEARLETRQVVGRAAVRAQDLVQVVTLVVHRSSLAERGLPSSSPRVVRAAATREATVPTGTSRISAAFA